MLIARMQIDLNNAIGIFKVIKCNFVDTHTHMNSVVNCACCSDRGKMIESRVSNTLCIEMSVNDFQLRQQQRTKSKEMKCMRRKLVCLTSNAPLLWL